MVVEVESVMRDAEEREKDPRARHARAI